MIFKEWIQEQLLLEDVRAIIFREPQNISVKVNGKVINLNGVEVIDTRFEDWHLDWVLNQQADPPINLASGGQIQNGMMVMRPKFSRTSESIPPKGNSFSLPLADGRYINYKVAGWFDKEISVDSQPKWELVSRSDWADFSEIIGQGDKVLKPAKFDRDERISLLMKHQAV